jgi:hypothetical protein
LGVTTLIFPGKHERETHRGGQVRSLSGGHSRAAQAMEKEGEIRIAAGALDGRAEVEIGDTESGIPPENFSKIFEPFFTGK